MNEHMQANRELWDKLVPIHAKSKYYDLDGFRAGKSSLCDIELNEVGDVSGKSLLHLQCHFGLDTLSWARMGANVTGVDFSEQAISLARSVASDVGVAAQFLRSNVYDLPECLDREFDIVFTSYGVLTWLPDLTRWAQVAAHFLKPGGMFYIAELHPFAGVFDDETDDPELKVRYPYFGASEPMRFESTGTYADPTSDISGNTFEWPHGISDILNALMSAGLRLEYFHEFPFSVYKGLRCMKQGSDGYWHLKEGLGDIPLMFSVKATKPAD